MQYAREFCMDSVFHRSIIIPCHSQMYPPLPTYMQGGGGGGFNMKHSYVDISMQLIYVKMLHIIFLTRNLIMSTYEKIMLTCDLRYYIACQCDFVAC